MINNYLIVNNKEEEYFAKKLNCEPIYLKDIMSISNLDVNVFRFIGKDDSVSYSYLKQKFPNFKEINISPYLNFSNYYINEFISKYNQEKNKKDNVENRIIKEIEKVMGKEYINKMTSYSFENFKKDITDFSINIDIINKIKDAKMTNKKVVVYCDFDNDGLSAGVILKKELERFGISDENLKIIVSKRHLGYGLKEELIPDETDLIITVDTGMGSELDIKNLKNKGIDIIVTDHHLPKKTDNGVFYPETYINTTIDKNPVFKGASGAFNAFLLGVKLNPDKFDIIYNQYVDLLASTFISDVCPNNGLKNLIVWDGIEKIRTDENSAIRNILYEKSCKYFLPNDMSFSNIRDINRISRAGFEEKALEVVEASLNSKEQTEYVLKQCDLLIEDYNNLKTEISDIILLGKSNNYNYKLLKEDVGFYIEIIDKKFNNVASLLSSDISRKDKMFFVAIGSEDSRNSELVKFSCRSKLPLSLDEISSFLGDILYDFGGHDNAFGLTIKKENYDIFLTKIEELTNKYKGLEVANEFPVVDIDANEFSLDFLDSLIKTKVYLPIQNQVKVRLLTNVESVEKNSKSSRLFFKINQNNGIACFSKNEISTMYSKLKDNSVFEFVTNVSANEFNGKVSLQGVIDNSASVKGEKELIEKILTSVDTEVKDKLESIIEDRKGLSYLHNKLNNGPVIINSKGVGVDRMRNSILLEETLNTQNILKDIADGFIVPKIKIMRETLNKNDPNALALYFIHPETQDIVIIGYISRLSGKNKDFYLNGNINYLIDSFSSNNLYTDVELKNTIKRNDDKNGDLEITITDFQVTGLDKKKLGINYTLEIKDTNNDTAESNAIINAMSIIEESEELPTLFNHQNITDYDLIRKIQNVESLNTNIPEVIITDSKNLVKRLLNNPIGYEVYTGQNKQYDISKPILIYIGDVDTTFLKKYNNILIEDLSFFYNNDNTKFVINKSKNIIIQNVIENISEKDKVKQELIFKILDSKTKNKDKEIVNISNTIEKASISVSSLYFKINSLTKKDISILFSQIDKSETIIIKENLCFTKNEIDYIKKKNVNKTTIKTLLLDLEKEVFPMKIGSSLNDIVFKKNEDVLKPQSFSSTKLYKDLYDDFKKSTKNLTKSDLSKIHFYIKKLEKEWYSFIDMPIKTNLPNASKDLKKYFETFGFNTSLLFNLQEKLVDYFACNNLKDKQLKLRNIHNSFQNSLLKLKLYLSLNENLSDFDLSENDMISVLSNIDDPSFVKKINMDLVIDIKAKLKLNSNIEKVEFLKMLIKDNYFEDNTLLYKDGLIFENPLIELDDVLNISFTKDDIKTIVIPFIKKFYLNELPEKECIENLYKIKEFFKDDYILTKSENELYDFYKTYLKLKTIDIDYEITKNISVSPDVLKSEIESFNSFSIKNKKDFCLNNINDILLKNNYYNQKDLSFFIDSASDWIIEKLTSSKNILEKPLDLNENEFFNLQIDYKIKNNFSKEDKNKLKLKLVSIFNEKIERGLSSFYIKEIDFIQYFLGYEKKIIIPPGLEVLFSVSDIPKGKVGFKNDLVDITDYKPVKTKMISKTKEDIENVLSESNLKVDFNINIDKNRDSGEDITLYLSSKTLSNFKVPLTIDEGSLIKDQINYKINVKNCIFKEIEAVELKNLKQMIPYPDIIKIKGKDIYYYLKPMELESYVKSLPADKSELLRNITEDLIVKEGGYLEKNIDSIVEKV